MHPLLSSHFKSRQPSAIRLAQIVFAKRTDGVRAVNTAIGNVTLPMHPAMQQRMFHLDAPESPLRHGVVSYTPTVGTAEAREAFLNVIAASGCQTTGLHAQITEGGSAAMELIVLGLCGPAGTKESPLLLIDAAYTNYMAMAQRTGRATVSVQRRLGDDGKFSLPDLAEIERVIVASKPGALVVIPYDNPTGHFYEHVVMVDLARLCVKHGLWMVSDEAYRELHYVDSPTSSIWAITEADAPGIYGRRISIETASKVWNACGLRIGAIVTDNFEFHEKSVAENTANLGPNAIGQYIFGALAHESHADLNVWFVKLKGYYKDLMTRTARELKERLPGVIMSSPDASIYAVVDVKKIAKPGFDAREFVLFCAEKGFVEIGGERLTLLVSPMADFYNIPAGQPNPGLTQMRIAYVATPEEMALVPELFERLFKEFESGR